MTPCARRPNWAERLRRLLAVELAGSVSYVASHAVGGRLARRRLGAEPGRGAGSEPVRSSDICERQGIPRRYLEQVLQQLVHHEVLAGQRGPRGGYRLARDGEQIKLGDIIRIVRDIEGTPDPVADPGGSELGQRIVRPIWRDMQQEMMDRFDSISVADLCRRADAAGLGAPAGAAPTSA